MMNKRIILVLGSLLFGFAVMAQDSDYNPEPNTPEDNWCYAGGVWGDGRCDDENQFITDYNWMIGWYMPRCEANVFPSDNLPSPCIIPEEEIETITRRPRSNSSGGGGGDGSDTDGDGMADWWEISYFGDLTQDGTDDGDSDNCNDLCEYQIGSDPTDPDTDGDTYLDGDEVAAGSDPRDASSTPDTVSP